jgi:hypothetical protein
MEGQPILSSLYFCFSDSSSPLLLVLGKRCSLELGLWRRRVTDGVV